MCQLFVSSPIVAHCSRIRKGSSESILASHTALPLLTEKRILSCFRMSLIISSKVVMLLISNTCFMKWILIKVHAVCTHRFHAQSEYSLLYSSLNLIPPSYSLFCAQDYSFKKSSLS